MQLRSQLIPVVTLMAFLIHPTVLFAQAPSADPACACFAPPPGGADEDEDEDAETPPGGSRTNIALLGVAGLVALTGIPFGGAMVQGLPFAQGAAPPTAPSSVETVTDAAPEAGGEVALAPPVEARSPSNAAAAPRQIADLPLASGAGVVPPKTATHLPLMLALGLALVGGGGVLSRRERRRRKRRRRINS